jgi:hypothetical protein
VATTLANKQHPASLISVRAAGGRSDMRTRVAAPGDLAMPRVAKTLRHAVTSEIAVGPDIKFGIASRSRQRLEMRRPTVGRILGDETARASQKTVIALLRNRHLTT